MKTTLTAIAIFVLSLGQAYGQAKEGEESKKSELRLKLDEMSDDLDEWKPSLNKRIKRRAEQGEALTEAQREEIERKLEEMDEKMDEMQPKIEAWAEEQAKEMEEWALELEKRMKQMADDIEKKIEQVEEEKEEQTK